MRFFVFVLALLVTLFHAMELKQQVASMLGCNEAAAEQCADAAPKGTLTCDSITAFYNTAKTCFQNAGCPTGEALGKVCALPFVTNMNCPFCNGGAPSSAPSITAFLFLIISTYILA